MNINLPAVADYPAERVNKYFNQLVDYCHILTKYVQWINIRKTTLGLRFWVRTRNFIYVGDYESVFDSVMGLRYTPKQLKKMWCETDWNTPLEGKSTFVKIKQGEQI